LHLDETRSGRKLPAVGKISKNLVTYMAGLVAVSPYKHGPFDSRAKGVAKHSSAEAMENLNKLKNEPYIAYLKRKLGEWYCEASRPLRKQPVDEEEEPTGGGAGAGGTAGEAEAEDATRWR
jgi:hypothetical protein